ncbi:MAG: methyltransferase [Chloroflexota bacterium]
MAMQPDAQNPTALPEQTAAREQLWDMIRSFRVTQMIYVAAKLSIADLLKDGPQSPDALAQVTGTHAPSLYRLLRGLASMGIFAEDQDGRFGLTPTAVLLQTDVPGSQRPSALVLGEESRWRAWGELLYSITTGEPAFDHIHGMDSWEYLSKNPELSADFNDYMTTNTTVQAAAIAASYDFSSIGTLVDVGGGHGILISAILRANPELQGILCDAPHVVEGARPLLEAMGVSDRCKTIPCDFFASVPKGGDAYLFKFIIHDWNDEQALAILKNCRRAMPEHGRLLLVENVIRPGNDPDWGKLSDLQMLVILGGRERTEAEYSALYAEAGFKLTSVVPAGGPLSIVEGVPV